VAWLDERRAVTVNEGWERYARRHRPAPGLYLGDEWSDPAAMGIDAAPGEVVATIDRLVLAPFLGHVGTALEIGAGGGRFTATLVGKGDRVIAAEVAPAWLPHLRARFADCTNVETLLLDGHGLRPLPDASVDAVLSYGVFVHLPHWDVFNYLREIERVLVPGGKAAIQHANTFSDLGWRQFVADVPGQIAHHKFPGSYTLMTPDVFAELSRRAHLEVVDCVTDVVRRDAITLLRKPA
jgi:cyclopropane fatty-acyl-phospholipid synthase-like methyltransferase